MNAYLKEAHAEIAAPKHHDLLIDGRRVPAMSGRYFDSIDPATEELIGRVAEGDAEDIDVAVRSARAAFEQSWGRLPGRDRGRILLAFADQIRAHADELVELESLDSGKPVSTIRRQDLPAVLDTLTYYAGWADKINGQVVPTRADALTYVVREPVGVVGAIVPWNFPLMIGMWKIAPALACGCTVVLKPAELTSLTALRLGELALAAGLPAGVLNVVPGYGKTAGVALVEHPDVDKITFTGSPAVGRQILRGAAGNFKRVTLELGGKSANIICTDADIDQAVKAASAGIFFNSGQVCSAGSRILAHESIYDEVVERLAVRARAIRLGDPRDPATAMGPLVSDVQMRRVLGYIDIGRNEGAQIVAGGSRRGDSWILHRADRLRGRRARHAHLPGGDLRPGRQRDRVQGRGGRDSDRQRHELQPRCRRVERGHRADPSFCESSQGRHRVGQYFWTD